MDPFNVDRFKFGVDDFRIDLAPNPAQRNDSELEESPRTSRLVPEFVIRVCDIGTDDG